MKKLISLLLPLILLSACSKVNDDRPIILTTFYAMEDLTIKVVGNKYNVINLTPAGSEPHDYEPSSNDIRMMYDCELIIANGLGIESWMNDLPTDIKNKIVYVGEDEKIVTTKINNTTDPHVWVNPLYAEIELENIKDAVISIDTENSDYYLSRYNVYSRLLKDLDNSFKEDFKNYKDRVFVTSHKAFNYFSLAYSLNNIALNGLSPDEEPSSNELASLIDEINSLNITTIFYEEFSSSSTVETISKETNTKIDTLLTLESLESDEASVSDYISVMRNNADKILESFK